MEIRCQKLGFTPRLVRHVSRNGTPGTLALEKAHEIGYHRNLSLLGESHRRAMLGACKKTGNFTPQVTPSGTFSRS